jgi:hypothetical protein
MRAWSHQARYIAVQEAKEGGTVDVTIPVEPDVAAALADARNRAAVGRLVSRVLRRRSGAETLVSSDDDLLVLHPWRGVRILRPAEYLALP